MTLFFLKRISNFVSRINKRRNKNHVKRHEKNNKTKIYKFKLKNQD